MVVVEAEEEEEGREAGEGRMREVEVGRVEVDARSREGMLILRGSILGILLLEEQEALLFALVCRHGCRGACEDRSGLWKERD